MTSYLRAFVESVTDLPSELQRHFQGIRDLDIRVNNLQRQINDDCIQLLKEEAESQQAAIISPSKRQKTAAGSANPELSQNVDQNLIEVLKLSEEKMTRAQQIYDFIDQLILRLDKDLKSFDAEIKKERELLGLPPTDATGPNGLPLQSAAGGARRKRGRGAINATPAAETATPKPPTDEELYQAARLAADPTEPTYCYCKRISYGDMIACEHPECPIEWFHFGCVGFSQENRPKGKWYCEECKASLNIK